MAYRITREEADELLQLERLGQEGKTFAEAARIIGRPYSTLLNRVRDAGPGFVVDPSFQIRSKSTGELLSEMIADGDLEVIETAEQVPA